MRAIIVGVLVFILTIMLGWYSGIDFSERGQVSAIWVTLSATFGGVAGVLVRGSQP